MLDKRNGQKSVQLPAQMLIVVTVSVAVIVRSDLLAAKASFGRCLAVVLLMVWWSGSMWESSTSLLWSLWSLSSSRHQRQQCQWQVVAVVVVAVGVATEEGLVVVVVVTIAGTTTNMYSRLYQQPRPHPIPGPA